MLSGYANFKQFMQQCILNVDINYYYTILNTLLFSWGMQQNLVATNISCNMLSQM